MDRQRLLLALVPGTCAAVLSLLMIRSPERIGAAAVLLFPGAVLAIITSGNIHDFPAWVVALGNFGFYFGAAYLLATVWRRFAARQQSGTR